MATNIGEHDRGAFDWGDKMSTTRKAETFTNFKDAAKAAAADEGSEIIVQDGDNWYVEDIKISEAGKRIPNRADLTNIDFVDDVAGKLGGQKAFISTEDGKVSGIQGSKPESIQVTMRGTGYFGSSAGTGGDRVTAKTAPDEQHTQGVTLRDGRQVYLTPADKEAFAMSGVVDFSGNPGGRAATYALEETSW